MEPTSGMSSTPVAKDPQGTQTKRNVNVVTQVFQGAVAVIVPSMVSMATYHPFYCIKTLVQADRSKTMKHVFREAMKDPKILIRGIGTSVFCSTPLAVIGGINDSVKAWYEHTFHRSMSEGEKMSAALAASSVGGVFSTVFEQVVSRQQVTGESFHQACRSVRGQGIRGFWVTVMRETQFGGFAFGVSPFMNKKVKQFFPSASPVADYAVATVSSIVTGFFGAVLSQPTDVVKTMVQTNATMTYSKAIKQLSSEGVKSFFKGLTPRAMGFALVINVMTISRKVLDQVFDKKQN